MKNIFIPETVGEYREDLTERALPEPEITGNDFYGRLIGWAIDNRAPLLYEQDHPNEYGNLSINFNWLLLRDYKDSKLGPPDTILAMYSLHELAHMTHWLPTRLDELSAGEYAEQFARSEYRASNETEVLLHYRVPELRERVFQGMRIAVDIMKERGIQQPSAARLGNLRPLFVEDDILDGFFGDKPEDIAIGTRLKHYNGNRNWAKERFDAIWPYFQDESLPQGGGLTNDEYEPTIANYEPRLSQPEYEGNVIRNVRLGYAMCGLKVPLITSFSGAIEAAKNLEGEHAIIQS